MDKLNLEGKKTDTLDATSASDEIEEVSGGNEEAKPMEDKVELNSSPVPTSEEVEDAGLDVSDENQTSSPEDGLSMDDFNETEEEQPVEPEQPEQPVDAAPQSDTPEMNPMDSEPVNPNLSVEENGVTDMPAIKTFTQAQVDDIAGKTRTETREKTFRYIYDRYGVSNEAELDELIGNAQRYDSLQEEYDGAKKSWKESSAARDAELANIKEQVALMQSGIDEGRYEDAKFILRGKGIEVTLDNIKNELATHPEWRKKETGEEPNQNFVKTGPSNTTHTEPVSKLSVLGNEKDPMSTQKQSEEDYALGRMFKV